MERTSGEPDSVVRVRRRGGKLCEVTTALGRRFLVLREKGTERFLVEGAQIGAPDMAELEGPAARAAAMALAYRLLARRDRAEREIREALAKEGIRTPELVDDVVDTLRRQGYLDDRRLAAEFVRYTVRRRPAGARLVRRKLAAAGVPGAVIEEELRASLDPGTERALAEKLARRKIRGASSREQAARRVAGLLERRGFDSAIVNDICLRVLRGALDEESDEHTDSDGP